MLFIQGILSRKIDQCLAIYAIRWDSPVRKFIVSHFFYGLSSNKECPTKGNIWPVQRSVIVE